MKLQKKATIVTLLDTPAFGGAEQYTLDSSVFLNKNGHKIIIFTNNDHVKNRYKEYIKKNKLKNFKVHDLPYLLDAIGDWKGLTKFFLHAPGACLWFYKTLKNIVETEKKSNRKVVCLLVGFTDRLLFSPIIKKLKAKLIWVDIGPLQPVFKRNWGFPKLLYHLTKHLPDHFTTTSKFTLSSMIKIGKIKKENITLVYPGIKLYSKTQIEKFRKWGQIWRNKNLEKSKTSDKTKTTLIGFVGRMATENEVDLLIRAFAKTIKIKGTLSGSAMAQASLSSSGIHLLHLVIMGDGPEKKRFQKLAESLGISNNVTFTGFISTKEKFSILATCDLFVFPRAWDWDGFGITTIEAMSVGTPVISPKFGPQMEIVKNGVNGLNFTPHNANDLSKKIIKLCKNPELRNKFSKKGLETTKDNFSYQVMKKSLLSTIKKVD
jgi:glycosyltransferase involved in cell wall biosynthesis